MFVKETHPCLSATCRTCLLAHCQATVRPLPGHCQATARPLPGHCQAARPGSCLLSAVSSHIWRQYFVSSASYTIEKSKGSSDFSSGTCLSMWGSDTERPPTDHKHRLVKLAAQQKPLDALKAEKVVFICQAKTRDTMVAGVVCLRKILMDSSPNIQHLTNL